MEHRILSGTPGYRDSWADDHAEGDFRAFSPNHSAFNRTERALSQVLNTDLGNLGDGVGDIADDFGLLDGDEWVEAEIGH